MENASGHRVSLPDIYFQLHVVGDEVGKRDLLGRRMHGLADGHQKQPGPCPAVSGQGQLHHMLRHSQALYMFG